MPGRVVGKLNTTGTAMDIQPLLGTIGNIGTGRLRLKMGSGRAVELGPKSPLCADANE
jgi:hypothetical protein